jgi:putative transposase
MPPVNLYEYLALGADPEERRKSYQALFSSRIDKELLAEIRGNTKKGLMFGNDRFKEQIEALTGVRIQARKRGRPLGWRKEG